MNQPYSSNPTTPSAPPRVPTATPPKNITRSMEDPLVLRGKKLLGERVPTGWEVSGEKKANEYTDLGWVYEAEKAMLDRARQAFLVDQMDPGVNPERLRMQQEAMEEQEAYLRRRWPDRFVKEPSFGPHPGPGAGGAGGGGGGASPSAPKPGAIPPVDGFFSRNRVPLTVGGGLALAAAYHYLTRDREKAASLSEYVAQATDDLALSDILSSVTLTQTARDDEATFQKALGSGIYRESRVPSLRDRLSKVLK